MKNLLFTLFIIASFAAKSQTTASDSVTVNVVEELKSDDVQLTLFPAATAANATLKVHTTRAQTLKIDLANLDGTVIRTLAVQEFKNSDQSVRVETYGLSGGSYLVCAKSESGVPIATKLLTITRN